MKENLFNKNVREKLIRTNRDATEFFCFMNEGGLAKYLDEGEGI